MAGRRIRDAIRRREYLQQCTLMDDEYMRRFFAENPACVQVVIRALLDMPELVVRDFSVQKDSGFVGARTVVLDVFASDGDGTLYNIEVQRNLTRATPRRARFHAALIDANLTPERDDFNDLPATYVIFVTSGDALGRGKPVYRFARSDLDDGEPLGDGSHIIFADATYNGYPDGPLADVMHDFVCPDPAAMHVPELAQRARELKGPHREEKPMRFITDIIHDEIRQEIQAENVAKLVADGRLSREDIGSILGLTPQQIEDCLALAKELEEDDELEEDELEEQAS